MNRTTMLMIALLAVLMLGANRGYAEQPPFPCHPNPNADQDMAAVAARGDIASLPAPLQSQIVRIAGRPHSQLPTQAFNEADGASQLFQYYLLDTNGFEPNVFTTIFPGVNDHVQLTATGTNCGLPTIGTVRVVLEPKPDLPTDPNDPRAFIDVFTEIQLSRNRLGSSTLRNCRLREDSPMISAGHRSLFRMGRLAKSSPSFRAPVRGA